MRKYSIRKLVAALVVGALCAFSWGIVACNGGGANSSGNVGSSETSSSFREESSASTSEGLGESSASSSSSSEDEPEEPTLTIENEVTTVKLSQKTIALTATSNQPEATVVWESSDETVATVEDGVVSLLDSGTVTITATLETNIAISDSVTIEVINDLSIALSDEVTLLSNRAAAIEEAAATDTRQSTYLTGVDAEGYYTVSTVTDGTGENTDVRSYAFIYFNMTVKAKESVTISFEAMNVNESFDGTLFWRIDANEKKNPDAGYATITSYKPDDAMFDRGVAEFTFSNTGKTDIQGFYLRIISGTAGKHLNFKLRNLAVTTNPSACVWYTNGKFDGETGNVSVLTAEEVKPYYLSNYTGKRTITMTKTTNTDELYEGATSGLKVTSDGDNSTWSIVYFVFETPVKAGTTYAIKYDAKYLGEGNAPAGANRKVFAGSVVDGKPVTKEYTNKGISPNPGMIEDSIFKFTATQDNDFVIYEFLYSNGTKFNFSINNLRLEEAV